MKTWLEEWTEKLKPRRLRETGMTVNATQVWQKHQKILKVNIWNDDVQSFVLKFFRAGATVSNAAVTADYLLTDVMMNEQQVSRLDSGVNSKPGSLKFKQMQRKSSK